MGSHRGEHHRGTNRYRKGMSVAARIIALLLVLAGPAYAAGSPCDLDRPCEVEGGDYYLRLPSGWDGRSPLPALLFFHGHNSSGASAMRSESIKRDFVDRGYLLIAPNGMPRPGSGVRGWPSRPMAGAWRDDLAFTFRVMSDVERRLPLDRSRILVSGFSSGGSMAWYLACYRGRGIAAFVPVAGGLRDPHPPERCPAGPARMLHVHGFGDLQVPLEGRAIRDWHQGDVFASLGLLRQTNACRSLPTRFEHVGGYRCRVWEDCGSRRDVRLCLHDGGHSLPRGWGAMARTWFESGIPRN